VNEKEAWAKFEEGLKDMESFDEAVAWVKKNKKIVEKLTMIAINRRFNEDISRANKTWRNLNRLKYISSLLWVEI